MGMHSIATSVGKRVASGDISLYVTRRAAIGCNILTVFRCRTLVRIRGTVIFATYGEGFGSGGRLSRRLRRRMTMSSRQFQGRQGLSEMSTDSEAAIC